MFQANANGVRVMALTATCVASGVSVSALAENMNQLDTIIVTASRTAQSVDDALAPVTVITREDIERSQAQDVPELLERSPGIQVTRNGGAGAVSSIFIRGAASSQTLVLVDGVRVNSSAVGGATLQHLNSDQIERIEVVRGPHSSLYGADAIGGVIQIFTRKGSGKPKLSIKMGGGSHKTGDYSIQYGGKTGNTRFNFGASLYETGGFDVTAEKGYMQGDDDAYRNKSLSASLTHDFDNGMILGFNAMNAEGKVEYDNTWYHPAPPTQPVPPTESRPYTDFTDSSASAFISLPVNDTWQTRVETGWMRNYGYQHSKDAQGNDPSPNHYRTWRNTVTWQNDIAWHESQLLTAGLDYYKDRADNSSTYQDPRKNGKEVDSRDNKAAFIQNQSFFDGHDLQLGLRHDDNEDYGENTTGNLAVGIDLPSSMRLVTSYGTAFRAPTFSDLFYPFGMGNPDLKPEKSKNFEVALRGKHDSGSWSLAVFQNDIEDMITWSPTDYKPMNIEEARIQGLEAQLDTTLDAWKINTTLTLLDPEDRQTHKQLVKRAKQMMTVNADRQYGAFTIGGSFRAQSKSYSDKLNTDKASGFGTVDLRASYRISKEIKTQIKMVNLFDKNYETSKGYNSEPFGVFASVTYTPDI